MVLQRIPGSIDRSMVTLEDGIVAGEVHLTQITRIHYD